MGSTLPLHDRSTLYRALEVPLPQILTLANIINYCP